MLNKNSKIKIGEYSIKYKGRIKSVSGPDYNYLFNLEDGNFARWGKTYEDDPIYSPIGPELLDIEVSTICHGNCPWCYKTNTPDGKNMNFKSFKIIFDKLPETLAQVAFGIGDLDANADLWRMFGYCREHRVIPNITINGSRLDENFAKKLATYCGAVAVSHYDDNTCFDAVRLLSEKGLTQVNIHKLLAKETYEDLFQLFKAIKDDPRLNELNAVVFLDLKQKGKRNTYHPLPIEKFERIINYALENSLPIGFDSCSAHKFLKSVNHNTPQFKMYDMMCEPCESTLFSIYINVDGISYPCSFLEGVEGINGIDLFNTKNFLKDVWYNKEYIKFRKRLIHNNRDCIYFKI